MASTTPAPEAAPTPAAAESAQIEIPDPCAVYVQKGHSLLGSGHASEWNLQGVFELKQLKMVWAVRNRK